MVFYYHNEVDNLCIEVFPEMCAAFYVSREEKKITGDVWLFNIGETPLDPPWEQEGCEVPCQNSVDYCYPHQIRTPIVESDFDVQYVEESETFGIYFRGKLVGILGDHHRPGKSAFAKVDSPAARTMGVELPLPT
jgi:hypothetical protein